MGELIVRAHSSRPHHASSFLLHSIWSQKSVVVRYHQTMFVGATIPVSHSYFIDALAGVSDMYPFCDDVDLLRLSIVKEIVDAHEWEIAVTDSNTGGARFEIIDVAFDSPIQSSQ